MAMDSRTERVDLYEFAKVPQPSWGLSDGDSTSSQPLLEGVTYKLTRTSDTVVRRGVALFRDRCITYHDPMKKGDATEWRLNWNCALRPAKASELVSKKRGIRPKGMWAITAAVQRTEEYVDVYELKVDWPPSWAATGYTDLVLGFTELAEAESWHEALSAVLLELRAAKGGTSSHHSRSSSARTAQELITTSVPFPSLKGEGPLCGSSSAPCTGARLAEAQLPPRPSTPSPAHMDALSQSERDTGKSKATAFSHDSYAMTSAAAAAVTNSPGTEAFTALDDDVSSTDEDHEGDSPAPDNQRWVPYRQTNGVAIYASEGRKAGEGEYMVSCVIRGRPQRVAAVLMRLRSNTTILGPAAHVELLQPADEKSGNEKEVLRLVLTASGTTGYFCAPREVILERMRKEEEDGVIVILFKSVELPNEADGKGKADLYGSGLFKRPVRATVAGGYTIAGLRGEGTTSLEALVTCIVKVDLGGVCGASSWLRPLASAAGWADSFLDRILMSVHLLRDEVEQRRFSVQPFKLVASAKARLNEDGFVVRDASVSADTLGGLTRSGQSMTRVPMLTARMASQRLSTGHLEADGPPAALITSIPEGDGGARTIDISSMHLNLPRVQSFIKLPRKYWGEVQVPGTDAPFHVRGPTYLKDKKKILAGAPAFNLGGVELIQLPPSGTLVEGEPHPTGVVEHVCRFLPSVRKGGAPFSIVTCLVVPGSPMLALTSVFCCDKHPSILGSPPARPMDEPHDWQPFDFVLHKFVYGSPETRSKMLKLVPHIASGSWMVKQSVGTTPVIIGKALKTTYHCTPTYIEVDIDISANSVANYVTGMVRCATTSMDIDLAFVLEGTAPWELPECLLGAFRLTRLDCNAASSVDWSKALPLSDTSCKL